jgi:hypothetical protein
VLAPYILPGRHVSDQPPDHVLWRMQGPRRVVCAAMYTHPSGYELRVFFEPQSADDILQREVEVRRDLLAQRANELRELLRREGWWPLPLEPQS